MTAQKLRQLHYRPPAPVLIADGKREGERLLEQVAVTFDGDGLIVSDALYALEYSQYSQDKGMFPYHIGPLNRAIESNLQDFWHNNRHENKWQIIFMGSISNCQKAMDILIKRKKDKEAKS